jgi:zinc protease
MKRREMKRFFAAVTLAALPLFPVRAQDAVVAPPPPAAPREAKIPQPVEKTLANGLRVIVVPKHDIPLVAARLMVKAGSAADPRGKAGVADMTSAVLTQGTKTKSAEQIARAIEALGATLDAEARWDSSNVDVSVMSSNLPKALESVADVVRSPTFANSEFERERAQATDALQVSLSQPRTLAGAVATRLIFGDRPYGREATPATLAKLKREDLVQFHRLYYVPQNAVLVMAGDVESETAFRLAQDAFGSWARGTTEVAPAAQALTAQPARVVVIDMPEAGSSAVVVGRRGIRRSDPSYMQALVTNAVLGGGYSARLNQEIRIKRGLSYGAGSSFEPRADVGPFTAATETKHESAAEVAGIMVSEVGRLSAADVPAAELTPRKASLIGGFAQSLETTSGIVERVSALARHQLPLAEINRSISGVQAVTAEDIRKFASSLGKDVNVVIVGDSKQFLEPLRKQFTDVEVIPYADLDLNSPTLRVRKAKK